MNLQKTAGRVRKTLEQFGVRKTAYDVLLRTINRVAFFKVYRAMVLEEVDQEYLTLEPPMEWRLLDASQLRDFANDPQCDITKAFLDSAIEKGDECLAIFDGQLLASYGWYSRQPTETSDDLTLFFNSEYVYMYKGFTHPEYRGKRLHAIGMNLALREYLSRGYKGLVSYVESNNFSSLKSVYRLGYQDIGLIAAWKLLGRPTIVASRGCRKFDLCFRPTEPRAEIAVPAELLETAAAHRESNRAIG